MKWTYSIQNKLTAAAVLFCLCLLVLLSNYNDRVHTEEVKEMISTLYQDRLIAEEYLFKISINIYQIREELSTNNSDTLKKSNNINTKLTDIEAICRAYEKTKLTTVEEIKYQQFNQVISQIKNSANRNSKLMIQLTANALNLLKELSSIQIEESKLVVKKSEQQYRLSELSSKFAFTVIIILLIVLQILVFSSKTFHISNKNIHLN